MLFAIPLLHTSLGAMLGELKMRFIYIAAIVPYRASIERCRPSDAHSCAYDFICTDVLYRTIKPGYV